MAKGDSNTDVVEQSTTGQQVETIEDLNKLFHIDDTFVPDTVTDIENYFAEHGGVIEFKGSAYDIVEKKTLIGKAFTIVDIRFYKGKWGDAVAVLALTDRDNEKVVFNDGSTGVFRQCLTAVKRSRRRGGFSCPRGLRASEYEFQETDIVTGELIGEPTSAVTYYIG